MMTYLLRTGSVIFHDHYIENLSGSGRVGAPERQAVAQAFGSL